MDIIIEFLQNPQNIWWGMLFALLAGILTSLSPCALSGVPIIGDYVLERGGKNGLKYSAVFCAGMAVVLAVLALFVTMIGEWLMQYDMVIHIVLAVAMAVFGLHYLGVIHLHPHARGHCDCDCHEGAETDHTADSCACAPAPSLLGAFWRGLVWGAVDLPCSIPALIAIAAIESSLPAAALLIAVFALGHSLLILGLGAGINSLARLRARSARTAAVLHAVLGVLMLLLGAYLIVAIFLE